MVGLREKERERVEGRDEDGSDADEGVLSVPYEVLGLFSVMKKSKIALLPPEEEQHPPPRRATTTEPARLCSLRPPPLASLGCKPSTTS